MSAAPARGLTAAEARLTAAVFGEAITPGLVRIYQRRWWPLQPRQVVMAPDGHMYFAPGSLSYRTDFGLAAVPMQAFFLHEMTHVWQHQSGINLILARGPFARYGYLPLRPGQRFEAYGIEQQAEIVRHYWLLRHGLQVTDAPPLGIYEQLLPFKPELLIA